MIMIRSTNTSKLNIKRRKRAGEKAGSVFFGQKKQYWTEKGINQEGKQPETTKRNEQKPWKNLIVNRKERTNCESNANVEKMNEQTRKEEFKE